MAWRELPVSWAVQRALRSPEPAPSSVQSAAAISAYSFLAVHVALFRTQQDPRARLYLAQTCTAPRPPNPTPPPPPRATIHDDARPTRDLSSLSFVEFLVVSQRDVHLVFLAVLVATKRRKLRVRAVVALIPCVVNARHCQLG